MRSLRSSRVSACQIRPRSRSCWKRKPANGKRPAKGRFLIRAAQPTKLVLIPQPFDTTLVEEGREDGTIAEQTTNPGAGGQPAARRERAQADRPTHRVLSRYDG